MKAGILRQLGILLAPDLAVGFAFFLAWWAPGTPGAATPADCRLIMLLEGLSILAGALVGTYLAVSRTVFPLVLAGCLAWLVGTGFTSRSLVVLGFTWYVISAFIEGVRAHRGDFGPARENSTHPHRRCDRMFLLYIFTAPILPALWLAGSPSPWAAWGAVYFLALAAVDTVLRELFDRIPQGILRRLKSLAPQPELGICIDCVYVQPAIPQRPGHLIRCSLSATDPRFPEYPPTPVQSCDGFRRPRNLQDSQIENSSGAQ